MSRAVPALLLLAWLACVGPAAAEPEAGGDHLRLESPRGVLHLWQPADYDPATAGLVIYVHGYFAGVDDAWREHALAEQFSRSRENALFVAPEAPVADRDPVRWPSLQALLETVGRERPLPEGPLVVMGHSGAFRTILPWLSDRRLRHLILLDGLYGRELPFHAWLRSRGRGPSGKQLVVVAAETARKANRFAARYRAGARLPAIPEDVSQLTPKQRTAPVLVMRSQYEHMEIVTSGRVIPLLLQLMPLLRLGS